MRIDTRLVHRVAALPPGAFGKRRKPAKPIATNLAFRNLSRARMVKLATGQQMADFLKDQRPQITPLSRERLLDGDTGADLSTLGAKRRDALAQDTPLWFYVLREAEHNHGRLKGVGAHIVATTFRRAIRNS